MSRASSKLSQSKRKRRTKTGIDAPVLSCWISQLFFNCLFNCQWSLSYYKITSMVSQWKNDNCFFGRHNIPLINGKKLKTKIKKKNKIKNTGVPLIADNEIPQTSKYIISKSHSPVYISACQCLKMRMKNTSTVWRPFLKVYYHGE